MGKISADYSKYYSCVWEKEKTIAVGIPVGVPVEDVIPLVRIPSYSNIPDFWSRYLSLSAEKKKLVNDLIGFLEKKGRVKPFMGSNWNAIMNFWNERFKLTNSKIFDDDFMHDVYSTAKRITTSEDNDIVYNGSFLDLIAKKKNTVNFSSFHRELLKSLCAYMLVETSFLEKGEGYCYATLKDELSEKEMQDLNDAVDWEDIFNVIHKKGDIDLEKYLVSTVGQKIEFEKWRIYHFFDAKAIHKKESAELMDTLLALL